MSRISIFFFFNDTATTEIYTLSLHDALPISRSGAENEPFYDDLTPYGDWVYVSGPGWAWVPYNPPAGWRPYQLGHRSEEHTSELQSQSNLVIRLLLEKKKQKPFITLSPHSSR